MDMETIKRYEEKYLEYINKFGFTPETIARILAEIVVTANDKI
jgi:hypothetical protein